MPTIINSTASLHYELRATGTERVLFIQGVGIVGNGWKPQLDAMGSQFSTIAFDNRGIGRSTLGTKPLSIELLAADADAIAHAAGWDRYHVVGHSMGGIIAQRLALTRPDAVQSLSLLCTISRGRDAVSMSASTLVTALRCRVGTKAARRRAFIELVYPRAMLEGRDVGVLAAELAPLFGRDLAEQPPILLKQAMALRAHDCTPDLHRLANIPTLVVSAELDRVTPAKCGRALAAAIPNATYTEIQGAAHGLPIHSPDILNPLITTHITTNSRPSHQP